MDKTSIKDFLALLTDGTGVISRPQRFVLDNLFLSPPPSTFEITTSLNPPTVITNGDSNVAFGMIMIKSALSAQNLDQKCVLMK